jgi:DNA-binding transcriptional ArsR family regulator
MVKRQPQLNAVFAALADPTRRRIVERLRTGELTAGEIAADFAISQPAISKHLKVLEKSGVLRREIDGRVHRCRLDPRPMREAALWIEKQERFWNAALDRLDDYFATNPQPVPAQQKPHQTPQHQPRTQRKKR